MIKHLNRLYWLGYLGFFSAIFWISHIVFKLKVDDAFSLALTITTGAVIAGVTAFDVFGFALSYSARQLPNVRDKALPFHDMDQSESFPLSAFQWIKAVVLEAFDSIMLLVFYQPWLRNAEGIQFSGKPWRKKKPLPVLLIHGYMCNAAFWKPTRDWLHKHDITNHAITLEPAIGSIRSYAPLINKAITELLERTGAPAIKIIAHSMGGVAIRHYAVEYGHGKIAGVMTIGSPHYGTALSTLGIGKNVKQMAWGSFFLRTLRENPADAEFQKKITSLWSPQDNVVSPPCSSKLEFAQNIAVQGCGHVALVHDSTTRDLMLNWMLEDGCGY